MRWQFHMKNGEFSFQTFTCSSEISHLQILQKNENVNSENFDENCNDLILLHQVFSI